MSSRTKILQPRMATKIDWLEFFANIFCIVIPVIFFFMVVANANGHINQVWFFITFVITMIIALAETAEAAYYKSLFSASIAIFAGFVCIYAVFSELIFIHLF